jgi:tetratricopeptide (TPR) repeat protein
MDNEKAVQQILEDLRTQVRITNKVNVFLLIILSIILIASAVIYTGYFNKTNRRTWYDVMYYVDAGNYDMALSTALPILKKTEGDWYSHTSIARVYLLKNDFINAEKHYKIAHELFPSKENEDYLLATRALIDRCKKEQRKVGD